MALRVRQLTKAVSVSTAQQQPFNSSTVRRLASTNGDSCQSAGVYAIGVLSVYNFHMASSAGAAIRP